MPVSKNQSNQAQIARSLVQSASAEEQEALRIWATGLLQIRSKNLPVFKKAAAALRLTRESSVVLPFVKRATQKLKRVGWDERSWKARLGLGAIVATSAIFGGAKAGIAAFGSAIGVPLWIVFGAGAAFAGAILDEVASKTEKTQTTHMEIDADRDQPTRP